MYKLCQINVTSSPVCTLTPILTYVSSPTLKKKRDKNFFPENDENQDQILIHLLPLIRMGTQAALVIITDQQKRSTGNGRGGGGGGGKELVRRIKFPWLICRSSCREVKVKANPAVRGARIKVFKIWIQRLSGSQYWGLSIISMDRRINTPCFSSPPSSRRFFGSAFMRSSLFAPNDTVGAII